MRTKGAKNIKPAMAHLTLRVPVDVLTKLRTLPNYSLKIRELVEKYVDKL